jgi:hypothetical protein
MDHAHGAIDTVDAKAEVKPSGVQPAFDIHLRDGTAVDCVSRGISSCCTRLEGQEGKLSWPDGRHQTRMGFLQPFPQSLGVPNMDSQPKEKISLTFPLSPPSSRLIDTVQVELAQRDRSDLGPF